MKGKLSAAFAGCAAVLGAYRARKPKPLGIHYSDAPKKVLVVGGDVRRFGHLTTEQIELQSTPVFADRRLSPYRQ